MNFVQTVTGAVAPETLRHCQMHEHLIVEECAGTRLHPALLINQPSLSALELGDYRAAGGSALLDAQPGGAGRNASALRDISAASGVAIITVTGYHLPFFYSPEHWIHSDSEDALARRFIAELTCGCEEAPQVKPGAVKAALGAEGCEGRTETKFRAAVAAAASCGVALVVHTEKGAGAAKATRLALDAGIPARRILVCHVDRQAEDFRPHEQIAEMGVMLEYDTIGRFKYHDDDQERALLSHMLQRGCAAQLLLSLDTTNRRLSRYGGEIGLDYLLRTFLPSLAAMGVDADTLRRITVENPKRVFS